MKKILWGTAVIVFICLGFVGLKNFQNFGKRAKTAEAKVLAEKLRQILDLHKIRKGSYPGVESVTLKGVKLNWYKWGVGVPVKEYCVDCMITPDSYKIVIYGNIDRDPVLDIWVLESPGGSLSHSSDDVAH